MSGALHLAPAQSNRGPRGRKKGIFEILYRSLVLRLGHKKTIWAIVNRLDHLAPRGQFA
jgi:hypothetical protein